MDDRFLRRSEQRRPLKHNGRACALVGVAPAVAEVGADRCYRCCPGISVPTQPPDPLGAFGIGASVQGSGVMRKAIYAVGASAMFAASFFVALSLSAEVEARGSVPGAKTDRADAAAAGTAPCSGNAWPYFEASCLRDARNPFGQARDVRLVLLRSGDRLQRPRPSRHGRRRTLAGGRRFESRLDWR